MNETGHAHQIAFYKQFEQSKFTGGDFSKSNYSLPFYQTATQKTIFYTNSDKERIVYPTQYFYIEKICYPNGKKYNYYIL